MNTVFPKATKVYCYGDESRAGNIQLYCIVAILPDMQRSCVDVLMRTKRKFKISEESRYHCRIMFNDNARSKSAWKDLPLRQVRQALELCLVELSKIGVRCIVGVVNRNGVPPGVISDPHGEKKIFALAFQGATIPLMRGTSFDHVEMWADADKTKIEWKEHNWGGTDNRKIEWTTHRARADRMHNSGLIDSQGLPCGTSLTPHRCESDKPLLLDLPDIYGYVCAHALQKESPIDNSWYRALHQKIVPVTTVFQIAKNAVL